MTSRMTFTRVGVGVVCGVAVIGTALPALAAEAEGEGKASGRMTTLKPAAPSHAEPARPVERSQIGLGVGFFTESSDVRSEAFTGGQEVNDDVGPPVDLELESDSIFNVQAWYLRPIWVEGLRWGGGLSWFNKYAVVEAEPENEDEEPEPYVFGHLFQLGLQGEYEIARVASKLNVLFGLRAGGSLLLPSDNLRDDIRSLDRRGFDVRESVQFGWYIAPLAGGRWPLSERVAVRADLSVQFSKLWLFDAESDAGGLTSERRSALSTTRTQLLIGLDFGL